MLVLRRAAVLLALVVAGTFTLSQILTVRAASITVDTTSDASAVDGFCSLREAITAAQTDTATNECPAGSGADTISFSFGSYPQTITLSATLPTVTTQITLQGPTSSSADLVISGNNTVRVLDVSSSGNLTVNALTVANGNVGLAGGIGAGIRNGGTLTVNNSTFSGNSAGSSGGGIGSFNGTLTVTNSTFIGNSAASIGGGGGGIESAVSVVMVTNSTFSGNSANAGGGIRSSSATVTVTNSTFSGNSADAGGGIFNDNSTVTVTNSTFSGNSADNNGGGIGNTGVSTTTVNNSIIAGNTVGGSPTVPSADCGDAGTFIGNYNLSGTGTGCSFGANSVTVAPADVFTTVLSSTLANNGGSTQTLALLAGSPAINAGSNALIPSLVTTDQRGAGFPRVVAAKVDIGAVEIDPCPAFPYTVPAGNVTALIIAMDCANSNGAGTNDVINLTPSTYTLTAVDNTDPLWGTTGLPIIQSVATQGTLTIDGRGATITRASGSPEFRFFFVALGGNLTLRNITLTNGSLFNNRGGAIVARGSLNLFDSTLSGNQSLSGGAIFAQNSNPVPTLIISGSTFYGNRTEGGGGAIDASIAPLILSNSTITGNTATNDGGGILGSFRTFITNSTIVGNSAATLFGGGISGINVNVRNSIVANNTAPSIPNVGTLSADSGNNIIGVDPLLGTLSNNGGATLTMLPQAGSPAVNAGNNSFLSEYIWTSTSNPFTVNVDYNGDGDTSDTIDLDQRGAGFPRVMAGTVDIGAVEIPAPVVSITANDPNAAETASDSGAFTITRTGDTTNPLDVTITITGTATNGTDYTPTLTTTVTIPASSAFVEVQIDPVDDAGIEGAETAILTLVDEATYDLGANTSATVTIADNDTAPLITITANDPNAAETASDPGRFTITRTGDTTNALDVTITITGTATNGTDYTPTLITTATIPAGSAFVEVQIDPVDDASIEGAETAILSLVDGAAYDLGANTSATVTIADNDVLPTVTISATDAAAAEAGTDTGTFLVTRTGAPTGALVVSYTVSGTATAADYTPALAGTVTIQDGSASAEIIITPVDDAAVEAAETVILTLASGTGYTVGTPDAATVTITDNDVAPQPVLNINDVTLSEGNSGTTAFTFTVSLSSAAGAGGVTFDIAAADNTATVSDGDYTGNSLTGQSIASGSSSYTFTVLVTGDVKVESTETFFVNVTNIVGATAADAQGQGTITNDDTAGFTATETGGTTSTTEAGGTDTINVVLSAQPTSDVVISVTSGNTLEVTVSAAQLTFTTANWGQPQSVTVTGVDDAAVDGDQSVTVTFSVDDAASNDAFDTVGDQLVSVTNIDNDVLPTIDIAAPDAAAAEAGTDVGTFTITRTGATTAALNVSYSIGGSASGADYTPALTGTVTIAIGQASVDIPITPVDDTDIEGDETVTLTLVAQPSYTLGANTGATVTITDNDAPAGLPTVTISASDASAAEAGADTGTFLVTRSGATSDALTVDYTIAGTATNGSDYTPNLTGTVDIPIGQASAAITITAVNDTGAEGNEAVVLTLGASANYTVGAPNNAIVIIVDDDGTPTNTSNATAVPAPPLCSLIGGGTNRIIRADVPGGLNADVFCRIIVENSVYVQRAAEVGDGTLVNAGIIQAVDVFGFTANGVQVADFNLPITVCLQGSGRMFYRDATNAPRITVPLAVSSNNGYTCASIPNAGTVILLP